LPFIGTILTFTLANRPLVIRPMKASPTVALQLLTMPKVSMTFALASRTAPRCASVPVAATTVQVMT